ncbi:DNA cytosine methyltransferase [Noviherbaspirillum sp. CPCC 100848]|uniref:DNA (cytosine-5-)-methyltransferase n=1 Tax=Noviherbaspirillum album TaxID=3080276 RepID=A0ABU6JIY4_9BURK|nr:DNA cytosine methyltransferase [Noviherbaspirillum sp. CPCC 100848]MEC4723426.1 DNA cytosine methyltransferase [Noviherbaspirillum sp. CPCC 100848]
MNTFYEFFAGGGMAHAGLGEEWKCLFANDFCEKKAASYRKNWGDDHLVVGDIAKVKANQVEGQADLAWASFPCQDLSLAGNGVGLDGDRSGTFWAFHKLMKQLDKDGRKPHMIALENVYGAVTSHGGKDFEAIIKSLVSVGYRAGGMIIDAVHFVPQSRPRLFIVAVDAKLTVPSELCAETATPAWQPAAIVKAYNRLPKKLKDQWIWWAPPAPDTTPGTLDQLIEHEPQGVTWHTPEETAKLLEMMSEVNAQKVELAKQAGRLKVGTIYRRTREGRQRAEVRFDGISGCLRTPSGGSSRQTIIVVEGEKVRSRLLSPREAARLMGLSDNYVLPERYNDAYHLAGDGVAVPVVAHLARHIFEPLIESYRRLQLVKVA